MGEIKKESKFESADSSAVPVERHDIAPSAGLSYQQSTNDSAKSHEGSVTSAGVQSSTRQSFSTDASTAVSDSVGVDSLLKGAEILLTKQHNQASADQKQGPKETSNISSQKDISDSNMDTKSQISWPHTPSNTVKPGDEPYAQSVTTEPVQSPSKQQQIDPLSAASMLMQIKQQPSNNGINTPSTNDLGFYNVVYYSAPANLPRDRAAVNQHAPTSVNNIDGLGIASSYMQQPSLGTPINRPSTSLLGIGPGAGMMGIHQHRLGQFYPAHRYAPTHTRPVIINAADIANSSGKKRSSTRSSRVSGRSRSRGNPRQRDSDNSNSQSGKFKPSKDGEFIDIEKRNSQKQVKRSAKRQRGRLTRGARSAAGVNGEENDDGALSSNSDIFSSMSSSSQSDSDLNSYSDESEYDSSGRSVRRPGPGLNGSKSGSARKRAKASSQAKSGRARSNSGASRRKNRSIKRIGASFNNKSKASSSNSQSSLPVMSREFRLELVRQIRNHCQKKPSTYGPVKLKIKFSGSSAKISDEASQKKELENPDSNEPIFSTGQGIQSQPSNESSDKNVNSNQFNIVFPPEFHLPQKYLEKMLGVSVGGSDQQNSEDDTDMVTEGYYGTDDEKATTPEKEQNSTSNSDIHFISPSQIQYQQPRFAGDLYTPRFVRGSGVTREGLCLLCDVNSDDGSDSKNSFPSSSSASSPKWYKIKVSAYWQHLHWVHGVHSSTGRFMPMPSEILIPGTDEKYFLEIEQRCRSLDKSPESDEQLSQTSDHPEDLMATTNKPRIIVHRHQKPSNKSLEARCGNCGKWIWLDHLVGDWITDGKWPTSWWKHAQKCYK